MDARRNQVYTGIYQMDGDKLQVLEAQMAVEIDELAKKLCTYGKPVIFLGDGVSLIEWANLIDEILPANRTEITIEKDLEQGFDFRRITVEKRGE